jgi:hypothetical protein
LGGEYQEVVTGFFGEFHDVLVGAAGEENKRQRSNDFVISHQIVMVNTHTAALDIIHAH